MNETNVPPSSEPSNSAPPTAPSPQPPQEPLERIVTKIFMGRNGIRAGWRLTIFVIILSVLLAGLGLVTLALNHGKVPQGGGQGELTPEVVLGSEAIPFFLVLLAAFAMARMEGRRIADYGLPLRRVFCGQFWQGIAIGFASITALLGVLHLCGVFQFGTIALHGAARWEYGALWGACFLFVGFFEEFTFRGYPLFTLTTGMTFWPAAIVLSAAFGMVHHGNSGESWVGVFTAGAVGFLFCLIVRRTGDLWMPIGFHSAWDWGETYFYGVPDSGLIARGHLFNSSSSGPVWLTGGSVGPEGSWLCVALLVILWVIFALWLREKKYPNPHALLNPRWARQSAETLSLNL
jgi:uncharacterized protein